MTTELPVAPPKQSKTTILTVALVAALAGACVLFAQNKKLKSDLEQATATTTALQSDLAQAKAQISILEPLATTARQMPVSVSFREAILGDGLVLVLQNKGSETISHTALHSLW